jgi:4-hydroxy-tetrahydrodipicolinate synthase
MTKLKQLEGIFPAIPTPVHADGTLDAGATRTLLSYLLEKKVSGIVPLGGTGEYGALARDERVKMARLCAEMVEGRVPVIAGILDPGFHDALQAGKAFAAAGVDALMVVTPYYTNPMQQGIKDYFLRFADESRVPVLIYEIPARTRIAIHPEVLHELSRHENIVGMKACNTDMHHFLRVVAGVDDSFSVLSGEDTLFPLHVAAGARGGVLLSATVLPGTWRHLYQLAASGKTAEALRFHRRLFPFFDLLFAETNPGPMKSVLDLIGVEAPHMLSPLVAPAPQLQAALRGELKKLLDADRTFA